MIYLSQLNASYSKSPGSVSYPFRRHNIVIGRDGSVAITFIKDDEEMHELLRTVTRTLNRGITYVRTHNEPLDRLIEKKRKASPMTLYELFRPLPEADCKECGEAGCFSFAAKLFNGEREPGDCPYVDTNKIDRLLKPIDLT